MTETVQGQPVFELEQFFPYQLTLLQLAISDTMAELYKADNLSRHQWRVLVTLGNGKILTAKALGAMTNLEKMQTSRALKEMEDRGLLTRTPDKNDKRATLIKLTKTGDALYDKLVPQATERERQLLSVLSENEQRHLKLFVDKLLAQTRQMPRVGEANQAK